MPAHSTDTPPRGRPVKAPRAPKPNPERDAAIAALCELCTPGSTVYTLSVRRSGTSESIRCFVARDNVIVEITVRVAHALGYKPRNGAIVVRGGGTDRGFEIVHALSYALHGMPTQHNAPCGVDLNQPRAGYTLRQEWL